MPDFNAEIDALQRAGYTVKAPPPPVPENTCAICGMTDTEAFDEVDGFPLTDIRVIIRDREEGYANEKRWLCWAHAEPIINFLMENGFANHRHGGTDSLAKSECEVNCPTPQASVYDDEDY